MDKLLPQPPGKKVRKEGSARKDPLDPKVIDENWYFEKGTRWRIPPGLHRVRIDSPFGGVRCHYITKDGVRRVLFPWVSVWKGEMPPVEEVHFESNGSFSVTNLQPDRSENPDLHPVEVGVPGSRPLTLDEEFQRFFKGHQAAIEARGVESLDDAYDFDVEDDEPAPWSPHELEEVDWQDLQPDPEMPPPTSEKDPADEPIGPEGAPAAETPRQNAADPDLSSDPEGGSTK